MKFLKCLGLILLLVPIRPAQAHEEKYLDDKPQDVYNATTTLFITQHNLQYNQGGYISIADDRSISKLNRFTFVQRHGHQLQDLGNNGTAIKPIFFTLPQEIGITSGFHAYDIYFRSPSQFRYYDTKSPYTSLYGTLAHFFGHITDSFADICHSRNITPNWNVGFNFRSIWTDKGLLSKSRAEDDNVKANGGDIFTHYKTEGGHYELLAHFLMMKHRVQETGGALNYGKQHRPTVSKPLGTSLGGGRLQDLESSDTRKRFHLYHQFNVTEQLGVYHELRMQKETHFFGVSKPPDDSTLPTTLANSKIFLGGGNNDSQEVLEATTTVKEMQNQVGFKGDWKKLFYSGYYRYRSGAFEYKNVEDKRGDIDEQSIGLNTRYQGAASTDFFHFDGEYLLQGLYKAVVGYQGSILDLACTRTRYQPSFLAQQYQGYHRQWENQFTPSTATQIRGNLRLAGSIVQLRPHVSFTRVEKHIYFKNASKTIKTMLAIPKQDEQHANFVTWGTDLDVALGPYMRWDSELTFAWVSGPSAEVFHVPRWLLNTRLYYARTTAKDNGTMEAGIDMHWKDSYYADAYDPVTQQFYWQDESRVRGYPVLDLFVNFRIKHWSTFVKFRHWNEGLLAPVYFVTPFYPGQERAFDIGIQWSFFD